MDIIPGFSNRLSVAIAHAGKRKGDVARSVGLTPRSLSRYLTADRVPHQAVLTALAHELGVTVEYLLGYDEKRAPLADQPVANETHGVYTPDAVSLVGLNEEERRTILRMIEALRSGQLDVQQHLIGQLKIIELVVQSRRNQPHKKEGHGA